MDARGFESVWRQRAGRLGPALDNALTQAAPLIQAVSRFQMNRLIYSKPPDLKADGSPKWVQTRNLYNAEQAQAEPPARRVILVNRMVYAHARHELGRDGRKTTREAHWRDEARDALRVTFTGTVRRAVLNVLSNGSVLTAAASPESSSAGGAGPAGALARQSRRR
jgi:hypothetical protein